MKVPRRRFGRTEIDVPVLTCGGMRFQQSWSDLKSEEIDSSVQENLEATVNRALDFGINHIETARGYGTSEMQLGWVLKKFDRDKLLIQTKIHPFKNDGKDLRDIFETSLKYLNMEYVDFLSIHGINTIEHLNNCLMNGGVMDEARQLQKEGRVKFIGYSTHGGEEIAIPAAKSGEFDYVNLHWYYIYHPLNWSMIEASNKADMGVFLISPNDKGGMLYNPSDLLKKMCYPATPMQWHDCYCLLNPEIHTLSLGASKPSDFKEHVDAVCGKFDNQFINHVTGIIDAELENQLGKLWMENWYKNIPFHTDIVGGINVQEIIRLWTFDQGLGMYDWAKMRYNLLGNASHWFAGNRVENKKQIGSIDLKGHILSKQIMKILFEADNRYYDESKQSRISKK